MLDDIARQELQGLSHASQLSDRDRMINWRVRRWDEKERPVELVHLSGARLLATVDELGRIVQLQLLEGTPAQERAWQMDFSFTAEERQALGAALQSGASVAEAMSAALEPLAVRAAEQLRDLPMPGGAAWRHVRPLDRGLIATQVQGGKVSAWALLEGQAAWERMEELRRRRGKVVRPSAL